jgi:hypothetical protein
MLYPQKYILVLISVTGSINFRAMVWLAGLGKFKKFNDIIRTQSLKMSDTQKLH